MIRQDQNKGNIEVSSTNRLRTCRRHVSKSMSDMKTRNEETWVQVLETMKFLKKYPPSMVTKQHFTQ